MRLAGVHYSLLAALGHMLAIHLCPTNTCCSAPTTAASAGTTANAQSTEAGRSS